MQKKFLSATLVAAIAAIAAWNINKTVKSDKMSDITLANIEALAENENYYDECHSPNYGRAPRTEMCTLWLGGGWFTGSVKRVCDITPDASSKCTPVECGEYF